MFKLKELIGELKKSDNYKKFSKENPDSFVCAGFFVLDFEENKDKYQLDIFVPSKKKVAISEFPFKEIKMQEDKMDNAESIENLKLSLDLPNLEEKVGKLKEENEVKHKTSKIIAILKDKEWNLTCFSNTMDITRIKIDAETGECKKFERANLMEFIRLEKGKK